jgi:hypothetical protein
MCDQQESQPSRLCKHCLVKKYFTSLLAKDTLSLAGSKGDREFGMVVSYTAWYWFS